MAWIRSSRSSRPLTLTPSFRSDSNRARLGTEVSMAGARSYTFWWTARKETESPRLVRRTETDSFRVGEATSRCHKLGTWIDWRDSTRDRRASAIEWGYGAPPRRCHMTTMCLARREPLPARGRGRRRKPSMRPFCAWFNPQKRSVAEPSSCHVRTARGLDNGPWAHERHDILVSGVFPFRPIS
jgi:hypothetical protein